MYRGILKLVFNSQFGHEQGGGGRRPAVVGRRRDPRRAARGVARRHQQERRGRFLAAVGAAGAAGGGAARPANVAGGVAGERVVQAAAARLERVALLRRDRVAPANITLNLFQRASALVNCFQSALST